MYMLMSKPLLGVFGLFLVTVVLLSGCSGVGLQISDPGESDRLSSVSDVIAEKLMFGIRISWVDPRSTSLERIIVAVDPKPWGRPATYAIAPGTEEFVVYGLNTDFEYTFSLTVIDGEEGQSAAVTVVERPGREVILEERFYDVVGAFSGKVVYEVNVDGFYTTIRAYEASGVLRSYETHTYDLNNRLIRVDFFWGNELDSITTYSYPGPREEISIRTDASGSVEGKSVMLYTDDGRLLSAKHYDANGRLSSESEYYYDSLGRTDYSLITQHRMGFPPPTSRVYYRYEGDSPLWTSIESFGNDGSSSETVVGWTTDERFSWWNTHDTDGNVISRLEWLYRNGLLVKMLWYDEEMVLSGYTERDTALY